MIKIIKELSNNVIEEYNNGETLSALGRKYNLDRRTIRKKLIEYGVEIRPKYEGRINNFFSTIETPEQAYILGWIVSDGHLNKNCYRLEIHLQEGDYERILFLNNHIPNSKMYQYPDGSWKVYVDSKPLILDLERLGIPRGKKNIEVKPINLNKFLEGYFWAGVFDGDGTVYIPYPGTIRLGITGSKHMCEGFKNYTSWNTNVIEKKRPEKNWSTVYTISKFYSNPLDFYSTFNKLFSSYSLNNKLFLGRKLKIMQNFLKKENT